MPRLLSITDDKKRDAQIELHSPERAEPLRWIAKDDGAPLKLERLVKTTEKTSFDALSRAHEGADALAKALVEGDPEIDVEQVGRRLGYASRVWVNATGQILYAARVLSVVVGPDGQEKSRADFVDVEATVGEEQPPLAWSGRLMPASQVIRKFALVRKQQLRHVNGLTFDFLLDIARTLEKEKKMLVVGAGPRGQQPLVFQTNGAPFRGFLEGRTEGDTFSLVLHLSNLELKRVTAPTASPPAGGAT
jgi:hypothetical protein